MLFKESISKGLLKKIYIKSLPSLSSGGIIVINKIKILKIQVNFDNRKAIFERLNG